MHENRAAAHLDGVLRGADDGGADALIGRLDARAPRWHARVDRGAPAADRDRRTPARSRAIDVLGDAAGEGDDVRWHVVAQRIEAQQRAALAPTACARSPPRTGGRPCDPRSRPAPTRRSPRRARADAPAVAREHAAGFLDARQRGDSRSNASMRAPTSIGRHLHHGALLRTRRSSRCRRRCRCSSRARSRESSARRRPSRTRRASLRAHRRR